MAENRELAELHELVGALRRSVTALRARYDDIPGVRRIVLDAERLLADVDLLEADIDEMDLERWTKQHQQEKIIIPDTEYDAEFWRDVDDEGLGGYLRS